MSKLTPQQIALRNKNIISDFSNKPAEQTKTDFAKTHGVSLRTLGRILDKENTKCTKTVKPKTSVNKNNVQSKPITSAPLSKKVSTENPTKKSSDLAKEESKTTLDVVSWTITKDRFISVLLSNGEPLSVESNHLNYKEIVSDLVSENYQEAIKKMSVKHMLASIKLDGFEVDSCGVTFNGEKIVHEIAEDMIATFSREEPLNNILQFFKNLMMNPSDHMYKHLWKLIKHAGVTITPEGNVECFKLVTSDFKDIYSNKISNKVGETVAMRRTEVDENFDKTCSHGLHVCARQYISSSMYGGGTTSNILVKVLVKPQDFVAIPPDYQFTKARVCSYKVLSVVK